MKLSFENPVQLQIGKYKEFSKYILKSSVKPNILWKYLNEFSLRDTSFLYLHTGVIYQEDFNSIHKIIEVLMQKTSLFVRILSSSILIFDLAHKLAKYKNRILYSLPVNIPISENLLILHELQERNFKTYGMIHSSFEICKLIEATHPEQCESIWIDINPGKEKDTFQEIEKRINNRKIFERIRFYVCTDNLLVEDDQYFKMFPKNIIFYQK